MSSHPTDVEAMAAMLAGFEHRIDQHDEYIDKLVERTVDKALIQMKASLLSEEERTWVKLALQAQAQRVRLHQSIIDKSLTALLIGFCAWVFSVFLEYIRAHGWK